MADAAPPVVAPTPAAQPRNPETGQFRSMSDAVTALEALLPPDGETADEHEAEEGAEPELNSDEELGDEEDAEGAEDETSDEEESEEPESDDEEAEEEPARGRKFTVRIDGKDTQVDQSELVAGYQRQSDYTRKTQALANERKTHEQELQTARQERAEYSQLLPRLRQALQQGMGQEPNWEQLQAEDAANGTNKAVHAWMNWQRRAQQLNAVRAEEQRLQQRQAGEAKAEMDRRHAAERDALYKALPSWAKDKKLAKRESLAIARTMKDAGYSDDDLVVTDHRAMLIARKAALYDQLQARRAPLQSKMRQAPTVRPGGGSPAPKTAKNSAAQRFVKSGSVKDAASLLEHLI